MLEALRNVSCVPKEACEHALKERIATSDRLAANMNAERELCRERGPGCSTIRVATSIEYISRQVVNAFVSALASTQLSAFPRRCDFACDRVGLMLSAPEHSCHRQGHRQLCSCSQVAVMVRTTFDDDGDGRGRGRSAR